VSNYDFKAELQGDDQNERWLLLKELAVLALLILFCFVRAWLCN